MNQDLYKSCISCFATGIAIVTTDFKGQRYGITINSLCSVSLNPPMVLYCIDKSAERFKPFFCAEEFCVNILDYSQQKLSGAFAKNDKKEWEEFIEKDLKVKDTKCLLRCKTNYRYEGGDHKIIVASVQDCIVPKSGFKPLCYYRSGYLSFS